MVETIQTYILMHKEIPVAKIRLDSATASVSAVVELFDTAHIPVGIPVKKGKIDRAALNAWWQGRAIPASRSGLRHALEELHISSPAGVIGEMPWAFPVGPVLDLPCRQTGFMA